MKQQFMIKIYTPKMQLEGTGYGTHSEILKELDNMKMEGQYSIYKIGDSFNGFNSLELVGSCSSSELKNEFVKAKTKEIEQKYRKLFKGSMEDAIRILKQGLPDDWEE